jgi:serine/threonine protein kinase
MPESDEQRVHRLIGELLDVPEDQRRRHLEERLPGEAALQTRILSAMDDGEASKGGEAVALTFAAATERTERPTPHQIGRYQILRRIGDGGMGEVFLARDPQVEREVVLKVLRGGFEDDELRARFLREARAAGRLSHQNIVTIFDVDEDAGRPFIVMEYIRGRTLFEAITSRDNLSLTRKLEILEQLCDALQCAHQSGIIHRDVKPANVMLDDQGVVKVLDFGIARPIARDPASTFITAANVIVGTVGYIAPEIIEGNDVDARCDVFSTATVAYELLTFQRPFGSGREVTRRVLLGDVTPMRNYGLDIPDSVEAVVRKGLALRPEDRFASMASMQRAFTDAKATILEKHKAFGESPATPQAAMFGGHALMVAGAVILSLALAAAFAFRSNSQEPASQPAASSTLPQQNTGAGVSTKDTGGTPKEPESSQAAPPGALTNDSSGQRAGPANSPDSATSENKEAATPPSAGASVETTHPADSTVALGEQKNTALTGSAPPPPNPAGATRSAATDSNAFPPENIRTTLKLLTWALGAFAATWLVTSIIGATHRRAYNLTYVESGPSEDIRPDFLKVDKVKRAAAIRRGERYDAQLSDRAAAPQSTTSSLLKGSQIAAASTALLGLLVTIVATLQGINSLQTGAESLTNWEKLLRLMGENKTGAVIAAMIISSNVIMVVKKMQKPIGS